jgi:hypothetical protein
MYNAGKIGVSVALNSGVEVGKKMGVEVTAVPVMVGVGTTEAISALSIVGLTSTARSSVVKVEVIGGIVGDGSAT